MNYSFAAEINTSFFLLCHIDNFEPFGKNSLKIKIEILDASVTQKKFDIIILKPFLNYTENETGLARFVDPGYVTTQSALAALLRGALNPDPSSFYPIKGRGQYVDNVLQVENKEDTEALECEYIGIVPIVSPVTDGNDQADLVRGIKFNHKYYTQTVNQYKEYKYPFTLLDPRDYDIVDYKFLNKKNTIFVAEWDVPVKHFKLVRNSSFPSLETEDFILDQANLNRSTTIDNVNIVLQQMYFKDSDQFYEHATQQLLVFTDVTKEAGAKFYYGDTVPNGIRNPNRAINASKTEFFWVRNDVYFYSSSQYANPDGINYSHVITIDRYPAYSGACEPVLGNTKSKKMMSGYFDSTKDLGLVPNEWSNELLMYCEKKRVELSEVQALTNNSIRLMHYLVPIVNDEIQKASDILNFDEDTGLFNNYPEVKFIYAHWVKFLIPGNISRTGGKIVFTLPDPVKFTNENLANPVDNDWISFSADQVAFYKTTYDPATKKIVAFFKRGLMPNEAYGKPSSLSVTLEGLENAGDFFLANMEIYEVKYDVSSAETDFENYFWRENRTMNFTKDRFFSLPSLEIHVKLKRGNSTSMKAYELLEPFARFGVYIQELEKHRTIWGSAESHHVSDPGLQVENGGFATISNIGISSIPFLEYLTVGKGQLIPSASSTSRLEWKDIWGRKWSQPLRSVFPDVPPIPPPLRNFMMTTTYELLKPTGERVLNWISDESLDIRVQIKLLNNYPKYFQITTCKDNEVMYFAKNPLSERIFDNPPTTPPFPQQITIVDAPDDTYHIRPGNRAFYGNCFDTGSATYLSGKLITDYQAELIGTAYICSNKLNQEDSKQCIAKLQGLPTVGRRVGSGTSIWNYSPKIENYYPIGYIKDIMWDLTHYDYDDNAFDKAYKYHMDNNLPVLEPGPSWNPAWYKPHNLIAQPIWKGSGFQIIYSQAKTISKFPGKKGWWSDNLQNKDHTLLAGQANVNNVSVDKETLLPDSMWINIKNLQQPYNVNERLKNIHLCMFNQHRVKLGVNNQRFSYFSNVMQNNIIPIMPDLNKNDPRYTNFNCNGYYQYSPDNISSVNNIVQTPTIRDWLYFGANLRGNALENINVLYSLIPYTSTIYEGFAKVQDGGRFVYWNPANGPNSFLIVDNPVNVVEAKRCDLSINMESIPQTMPTFNAIVYQLITVKDDNEILRQFNFDTYTNNYGFGDSTVAVFVGGTEGSIARISAGQKTYAKITFYNNAGFDWNMFGSAIDFEYLGSKPINANDLLMGIKTAIQKPLKYNFLILDIPDDIKPYVTIIPSDHNIDVAPQFFDFGFINVVTIRDGFKGDYFYKITLAGTIPESIMGKVWEIKVSIDESKFDRLPGYNDPTKAGFHDYKLKVPSIKFGIPYPSGHKYAGKVFYTSGYSKNLKIEMDIPSSWGVLDMKFIQDEQVDDMRRICGNSEKLHTDLLYYYGNLTSASISYTFPNAVFNNSRHLTLDLNLNFPTFPLPNGTYPDIAAFNIMVKANASQLSYGSAILTTSMPKITYTDEATKQKTAYIPLPSYRSISAKGAWIQTTYSATLVVEDNDTDTFTPLIDQRLFPTDKGIVQLTIKTTNVGTDIANNVNFIVNIALGIDIYESKIKCEYEISRLPTMTRITLKTNAKITPGVPFSQLIYLKYQPIVGRLLQTQTSKGLIVGISAQIDLTNNPGENQVTQEINTPFSITMVTREREKVTLTGEGDDSSGRLQIKLRSTPTPTVTLKGYPIRFVFYRKIITPAFDSDWVVVQKYSTQNFAIDTPTNQDYQELVINYKVETYSETKEFLAANSWQFSLKKTLSFPSFSNPVGTPATNTVPSPTSTGTVTSQNPVQPTTSSTNPQTPPPVSSNTEAPQPQPSPTIDNTQKSATNKIKSETTIVPMWPFALISSFLLLGIVAWVVVRCLKQKKEENPQKDSSPEKIFPDATLEPSKKEPQSGSEVMPLSDSPRGRTPPERKPPSPLMPHDEFQPFIPLSQDELIEKSNPHFYQFFAIFLIESKHLLNNCFLGKKLNIRLGKLKTPRNITQKLLRVEEASLQPFVKEIRANLQKNQIPFNEIPIVSLLDFWMKSKK